MNREDEDKIVHLFELCDKRIDMLKTRIEQLEKIHSEYYK